MQERESNPQGQRTRDYETLELPVAHILQFILTQGSDSNRSSTFAEEAYETPDIDHSSTLRDIIILFYHYQTPNDD